MRAITLYLNSVNQQIYTENGHRLSQLLSLSHLHVQSLFDLNIDIETIENACSSCMQPWDDIIALHLRAALLHSKNQHALAFHTQKELVQMFQRAMANFTQWCLPVLYVVNNDLRALAREADRHAKVLMTDDEEAGESTQRKKLEEAANVMSKSFTLCITDRNALQVSKKVGTYRMVGLMFRTYFQLKQQNLCKNILRAVRAADLPEIDYFPKCDRVTFRYYLGRLYFLQEEYSKAENELDLAFRECSNTSVKNKELILQTLLPIRLMRGVMPSKKLLKRFPKIKKTYGHIVEAIKSGNIDVFKHQLQLAEQVLFRQGTYLAVEKAQNIAMRQLFRKVYVHLDNNPRIPISTFQAALKISGIEVDIEETEWMLANMIFKGYMKAYLSHEKMFAVLSKANPFPQVSSIPLQTLIQ
ncbi:hypothetical protein BDB00DRAFT_815534 [Zychaea mexicana]|uniref:uncharacterized protein n=1 Tax=Zychaea mexicana TaxID=64656 RepID=UPI0022FF4352|nr:uncharacterized protein BDB00DRAFT_815534 [Zychaea mexicana]KAI9495023.1 hypothetical protein BDB00DRAFT_815534 [Zychaea mexicana]